MTNGEFVSRIVNNLKFLNQDEHISRRFILRVGQNKAKFYISQKMLDKTIFRETNLFKTIECFRLEEEDRVKCGILEFQRCNSLMKSVKKIPGLIYSRLGSSIVSVTSMGGEIVFDPTTPKSYALKKNRKGFDKLKKKYYYTQDEYLYLPDTEIEYVTVTYIPYDTTCDEVSECGGVLSDSSCENVWDKPFNVPDKLLEQVISDTLKEVSIVRQISVDEMPDMDSNIKTMNER